MVIEALISECTKFFKKMENHSMALDIVRYLIVDVGDSQIGKLNRDLVAAMLKEDPLIICFFCRSDEVITQNDVRTCNACRALRRNI